MANSTDPRLRALRKQMGNTAYRGLVDRAHKQGSTVSDYADQGPLAPRSEKSLAAEATRAVGAAFKPEEQTLTTAMQREQAVNAKRERDMLAFQQWAGGQQQRFQEAAYAAQRQILGQNQEILAQQGQARAASAQAIQAQLGALGGDLAASAQNSLAMRPEAQAGQAAAAQMVGAQAGRATAAAEQATGNLAFMGGNQLGSIAAIAEGARQKGDERVQTIQDRINEVAAKKSAAHAEYMQGLSDTEAKKAMTVYETASAAAIAEGKSLAEAQSEAADRAFKIAEHEKDRSLKITLEQGKQRAAKAKADAKTVTDTVKFKAQYGLTQEQVAKMTPAQLTQHMREWKQATSTSGGVKPPTRAQARANTLDLQRAVSFVKRFGPDYTPAEIKQIRAWLREGREAEKNELGYEVVDPKSGKAKSPGFKQVDPDIANAALDILTRGGLSEVNRRRLAALGVQTGRYKPAKGKPRG